MDLSKFTMGTEPARFNVMDLLPEDPEYDIIRRQHASISDENRELLNEVRVENDDLPLFKKMRIDAIIQLVLVMTLAKAEKKSML